MRRREHKLHRPHVFVAAVLRQVWHIACHKWSRFRVSHSWSSPSVFFWPEAPHPYSVAYRTVHSLGMSIRRGLPELGQPGFLWCDSTFMSGVDSAALVNGRCTDISKTTVDLIHQQVFRYSLAVDPAVTHGSIVAKSDENGLHDGVVVQAPLEPVPGVVYQLLVDNRPSDGRDDVVCDYRVCVFDHVPQFGYEKIRSKASRFANRNECVALVSDLNHLFSESETEQIAAFCHAIGLQCGELDVVRDWVSRRIYVLDVNKTPHGPPNGLARRSRGEALSAYAAHYRTMIDRVGGRERLV